MFYEALTYTHMRLTCSAFNLIAQFATRRTKQDCKVHKYKQIASQLEEQEVVGGGRAQQRSK